jgi:hypothetical protein
MRTSFTTWVAVHSFGIFAAASSTLGLWMGVADLMHIQQYEQQHSMASSQEAM